MCRGTRGHTPKRNLFSATGLHVERVSEDGEPHFLVLARLVPPSTGEHIWTRTVYIPQTQYPGYDEPTPHVLEGIYHPTAQ